MDSILQVIAFVSIVLFTISLSIDPISGILVDLIPEKILRKLRWVLGIIAFLSIAMVIVATLKN